MWAREVSAFDLIQIALVIWVALLSIYLKRTIGHYRRLTKGAGNLNLGKILENIINKQELQAKQISKISAELIGQQNKSLKYFTKYAIIRFNPFEDAGGDQSFVIAFLDGKDNGIVISSLHSRSGTRVYAKQVIGAKPARHQFSKEEKEAVEKAARQVQSAEPGNTK